MEYLIINIKNPELGPQPVHPSVWNDEVTLRDMGYMRAESIGIPFVANIVDETPGNIEQIENKPRRKYLRKKQIKNGIRN